MKTLARHLFALIALFLCAPVFAQTSITPASHEVGAEVVPYQVLVNSTVAWTASANAAWVTLSRTSGSFDGNILVTAAANTTGADRTATITVDGATHTLTQRGTAIQELWGFGWDGYGQLGDNVLSQRVRPFHVVGDVQTVAAGGYQSLIVKTDGSLWAMGNNGSGELGDGTTTDRSSPVQILSGGVQAVAAGYWHSLIVKTDGSLWAMGDNTNGQLATGRRPTVTLRCRSSRAGSRRSRRLGAQPDLEDGRESVGHGLECGRPARRRDDDRPALSGADSCWRSPGGRGGLVAQPDREDGRESVGYGCELCGALGDGHGSRSATLRCRSFPAEFRQWRGAVCTA